MSQTFRSTYCGNVHAAHDLDSWIAAAQRFSVPIAERRGGRRFGLGVWWDASLARELRVSGGLRSRLRGWLAERGLEIWTVNVFPFEAFHDDEVKLGVYSPDWADEARVQYTLDAAAVVADLAHPGEIVSLSTLPLGYGQGDERKMARNLVRVASSFAAIEARTGVELVLAIEPEPFCLRETVAGVREFLQDRVFGAPDAPVDEAALRRHLGICIDLCHLAVIGEDPVAAIEGLDRAGVRMPKVQVSSCLELRDPAAALDELLAFDEPRYLHQTVSLDGELRALDLSEVRARRDEFVRADGLRTHFHLPIYWDSDGALGSTRNEVERVLAAYASRAGETPLLEVETYTWSVLDPAWAPESDLVRGIAAELDFVDRAVAV